jgi:hypothetical protein
MGLTPLGMGCARRIASIAVAGRTVSRSSTCAPPPGTLHPFTPLRCAAYAQSGAESGKGGTLWLQTARLQAIDGGTRELHAGVLLA